MKTFIGGKEIELYGKTELSKAFTNVVQSYLNSGFMIWMSGCSGSQGEIMKVDLSNDNGKTVYRVWMDDECRWGGENPEKYHVYEVNTVKIFVKKYEIKYPGSTLWMKEGEEVESYIYYKIDDCKCIYVVDENDFIELMKIHDNRRHVHYSTYYSNKERKLSNSSFKAAFKVARKEKGYKSILLKDITEVTRDNRGYYTISFSNRHSLSVKIAK